MRAIAVIAVMVYHFAPDWAPQGYIGVDVFFVLSGFLITYLLGRELEATGTVSLTGFWLRRARRILPPLFTAVLPCVTLALILGGDVLVGITRQLLSTLTFTYNWAEIAFGSTYFDQATPALLKNMWSLAVEEQFYLLWPLLAWGLWQVLGKRAWVGAAALSCASAAVALSLLAAGGELTRIHEGTDAHAYGLMLGAALAMASARVGEWSVARARFLPPAAALGLAAIVGLAVVPAPTLPMPVISMLASLASAVVVAALLRGHLQRGEARLLTAVLHVWPLRWVGERSYGMYLWHWPLAVLLFYAFPQAPMALRVGGLSLATVLAAALSYSFVERPILTMRFGPWIRSIPQVRRTALLAAFAVCLAANAAACVVAPV